MYIIIKYVFNYKTSTYITCMCSVTYSVYIVLHTVILNHHNSIQCNNYACNDLPWMKFAIVILLWIFL